MRYSHQWQAVIAAVIFSRCCTEAIAEESCWDSNSAQTCMEFHPIIGSNLLQVHAGPGESHMAPSPSGAASPAGAGTGPRGMRRRDDDRTRSVAIMTAPDEFTSNGTLATDSTQNISLAESSIDVLPPHLMELGRELLGSKESVDELVANTRLEKVTYSGIPLQMRMMNGDMSHSSMVEDGGKSYDLDSLRETPTSDPMQSMLHLLDLGGNYGFVPIAAFKKYPKELRAVVVEPIPTVYFLLRWNLWLNGIPELQQIQADESIPGVLALNRGVTESDGDIVGFCHAPPNSINAFACDCRENSKNNPEVCMKVTSISTQSLLELFGQKPIALMKVDCEGCEASSLPAMLNITKDTPDRIRRLAGELHSPSEELQDMACQYENGAHFVKICLEDGHYQASPLRCDERTLCKNEMPFLEQLRLLHFK